MTTQWLGETTESVTELGWTGSGFSNADANRFWRECCSDVQQVVVDEAAAGNVPWNILKNHKHGIVLVALPGPPRTAPPSSGFIVHTSYDTGNYCYDGTLCTYEHEVSGSFISFEDPDFEGPPTYGCGA